MNFPGFPSVPEVLTVDQEGSEAVLQWETPTGDYDAMSIRQCEVQTGTCTEHRVDDARFTRLELKVEPGVEYVFTMVLYQEDQVALESEPFKQIASEPLREGNFD